MSGSIVLTMFSGSLVSTAFSGNTGYSFEFNILWAWLIVIFILIVSIFLIAKFIIFLYILITGHLSPDVEINFGIFKYNIKKSLLNKEIAHKVWSEIMTRKAGIGFDKDHDIIIEIYDSWYDLFKIIRQILSSIPGEEISKKEVKPLVNLLIEILNHGLRPHLTKWQGKFRRWYNNQLLLDENKDKSPQEIQKMFSEYNKIIKDVKVVNGLMLNFANDIKKISGD